MGLAIKNNRVAIVDYNLGNVQSILNGFHKINIDCVLTRSPSEILGSGACILPGVGAFAYGMENLIRFDLPEIIEKYVETGKPILGICLGMQLLMQGSHEFGWTSGLNLIQGEVRSLSINNHSPVKLPHVSWNEIRPPVSDRWANTLLSSTLPGENVYFVHSYAAVPSNQSEWLSETIYDEIKFCSAVQSRNIIGVQFHPEKSGGTGLRILRKFADLMF